MRSHSGVGHADHPSAPIESRRLVIVLITIAVNVGGMVIASCIPWSDWRTAVAINLLNNSLLIWHVVTHKDRVMLHLIVFGLALGFTELAADAWLVDVTRSLDYSPGGGLMLWRSPVWMPFAWEIVGLQLGYIGMRLVERLGARGLLVTGLIGAINIPLYEEMALHTHWWQYRGAHMVSNTPWYIIGGEFVIAVAIAWCARHVRTERTARTILAGVAAGVAIFFAYTAAWLVIDA